MISGHIKHTHGSIKMGTSQSQVINRMLIGLIVLETLLLLGPQIHSMKMSLDAKCINGVNMLGGWHNPYMGSLAFGISKSYYSREDLVKATETPPFQ